MYVESVPGSIKRKNATRRGVWKNEVCSPLIVFYYDHTTIKWVSCRDRSAGKVCVLKILLEIWWWGKCIAKGNEKDIFP